MYSTDLYDYKFLFTLSNVLHGNIIKSRLLILISKLYLFLFLQFCRDSKSRNLFEVVSFVLDNVKIRTRDHSSFNKRCLASVVSRHNDQIDRLFLTICSAIGPFQVARTLRVPVRSSARDPDFFKACPQVIGCQLLRTTASFRRKLS